MKRALVWLVALLASALLVACASGPDAASRDEADDLIIVAIAEGPASLPAVGGSARGDYRRARYFGSDAALAAAHAIAREQRLTELAAWTIQPLSLRCMLYRLPAGANREAMLAALRADPRVALAQPSNRFETLATPAAAPGATPNRAVEATYNDPYLHLQHGLASIGALAAQQWGQGEKVSIAVIDGAVDLQHPDLAGRIGTARDFVRGGAETPAADAGSAIDRHGSAVAGVIAATANNGIGIVGVAPQATLLPLRACWAVAASAGSGSAARCSTFTLAQALVAALAAGADVINLSLGGPRDPLLEQLTAYAIARGTVVVGALPASGRVEGFPAGVPGVLVAGAAEGSGVVANVIAAPGRRVFSLAPGGGYAYHDGSSMAAAHVSGAAALLRSIQPGLPAADIRRLLAANPAASTMALCGAARQVARGASEQQRFARAC